MAWLGIEGKDTAVEPHRARSTSPADDRLGDRHRRCRTFYIGGLVPLDYDAVQCQESTPVPDNAQINQPLRELSSDTSSKSKSLLTNAQFFLPDFADTGESPGRRAWTKMLGAVVEARAACSLALSLTTKGATQESRVWVLTDVGEWRYTLCRIQRRTSGGGGGLRRAGRAGLSVAPKCV